VFNGVGEVSRVVIAPGADAALARAAVPDADWHWLAPGFPPIETPMTAIPVPTASLLRELDAELPRETALAVIVPSDLGGLDGERPLLSRAVDWHVVPGRSPHRGASEAEAITLAVRYAPAAEPALRYLRAAVDAMNAEGRTRYTLDAQPRSATLDAATRELVWLGSDPPSAIVQWIEAGGTALVDRQPNNAGVPIWRDAHGDVLARIDPRGEGRLVALRDAFSAESLPALLDADFPDRLRELLQGSAAAPTRAPADTARPGLRETKIAAAVNPASTKPLDPWLAMLVALLFLIERAIATRAREPT